MSPYAKYQQSQTLTADQGTLILMLYDGASTALKKSKQMLESPSYSRSEFSEQIVKAQNIVMELIASLDFEAGEIAQNLWRLYEYMVWQIRQADLKKDPQLIDDVLSHLSSLRDVWAQVFEQHGQSEQASPVLIPQQPVTRNFMVA